MPAPNRSSPHGVAGATGRPPSCSWADEVHFGNFDGYAYYDARGEARSQSYACIAYHAGLIKFTPAACRSPDTVQAAAFYRPAAVQSPRTISGLLVPGAIVSYTLPLDGSGRADFTVAATVDSALWFGTLGGVSRLDPQVRAPSR